VSVATFLKLWQLLTSEQRRMAVVLFGLLLIGMTLEMLGIGLIIPALALMSNQDLAAGYPALESLLNRLGNPTPQQVVAAGLLILLGVYAVKAVFLAFVAWRQASFTARLQVGLSQRLFEGYLRQPWTFHLQRNSAQLIHNAVNEVSVFLYSVIHPALALLTEGLILFGIGILLLLVEPLGALVVVSVLGLAAWGFHRLTRGYLLRWGTARQYHEGLRIQRIQEGLGGAKEVKLLGREAGFLAQYLTHNVGSGRVLQRQTTLLQLPRLWIELLAVAGLVTLGLVMMGRGKPFADLLPTLGLFAAAAFRLLPSVNRLMGALQTIRYALPVVDTLYQELQVLDTTAASGRAPAVRFERRIELVNINHRYPNTQTPALSHVSLSIPRGASVGFIGGSGAGKTTLVDVILGLLSPASGRVLVDGTDIQTNLRGWQDQIGYVPQSIFLTDDTLRRNVAFGLPEDEIDDAAVRRAILAAQLEEFAHSLPEGLNTLVGERGVRLSGGQRQRIGIARALYHDPPVLVLDEATSSLDTATEQGVMEAVNALQGNKTLLIVAHRVSTVARCDRLYRLEQGRVLQAGALDEVVQA